MPDSATAAALMSGPDSSKVPLMSLSMPGGLASPHLLDTPCGLMSLMLPDALPTTPDMLAAAMNSAGLGSLISPQAFLSAWTPRGFPSAANVQQSRQVSSRDDGGACMPGHGH
jgi:hypothetical protein